MQIKFNEVTDSLLKYCPYIAIPVGCDIRHYSNKNFRFFGPRLRYLSISQQNFGLFLIKLGQAFWSCGSEFLASFSD